MKDIKTIDIRADYATFVKFYDEVLERKSSDEGIEIEADPLTGKQSKAHINMRLLGDIYNEFYGEAEPKKSENKPANFVPDLLTSAQKFLGVPYAYGKSSPEGCDCSGFVKLAFSDIGGNLPHQSASQAALGVEVKVEELVKGDLLFFNTDTPKGTRVNHVGIVLDVRGAEIDMIHASSGRKKVLIDQNVLRSNAYWHRAFLFAKRIETLESVS